MLARVLAALLATAMVVGAVVVRRAMDDDGNSPGRDRDVAATRVICADDLVEDVCSDPGMVVEPEADTADALIDADGRRDADVRMWLAVGPWPSMVDEARRAANKPGLFEVVRPLAGTELAVIVRNKPAQCPAEVTWRCLGDALVAGARVSGPPRGTGIRLLATAAFATAYLGRSDFASNDITDDPAASDWLYAVDRGLETTRQFGATSVADFLTKPGAADVFVTTAADAVANAAPPSQRVTPEPLVKVGAYLGGANRRDAEGDLARELEDRLQLFNWRPPVQVATGLPSPGVLQALRDFAG